jgi:hypothetical protein
LNDNYPTPKYSTTKTRYQVIAREDFKKRNEVMSIAKVFKEVVHTPPNLMRKNRKK